MAGEDFFVEEQPGGVAFWFTTGGAMRIPQKKKYRWTRDSKVVRAGKTILIGVGAITAIAVVAAPGLAWVACVVAGEELALLPERGKRKRQAGQRNRARQEMLAAAPLMSDTIFP